MPDQTDPIQFEVIRNALLEATEEMAIALRRSAYSTNIKTRADFSLRLFRPPVAARRPGVYPASASRLADDPHAPCGRRIRP